MPLLGIYGEIRWFEKEVLSTKMDIQDQGTINGISVEVIKNSRNYIWNSKTAPQNA